MGSAMRFVLMMVVYWFAVSPAAGDSRSRSVSIRSKPGEFGGVEAIINLWNLSISDTQYSSSSVKIYHGYGVPGSKLSFIEAGWMVNRRAFSDYKPRLFARWSKDGKEEQLCLELGCQGFVQFSNYLFFGQTQLSASSEFGGTQVDVKFSISRQVDGQWWIEANNEAVGYWPPSIFNNETGNVVEWGGKAFNGDPKNESFPPLGSGHFSSGAGEFKVAAYMKQLKVLNGEGQYEDAPSGDGVVITNEAQSCYALNDHGNERDWGRYFYFGGPGGKC